MSGPTAVWCQVSAERGYDSAIIDKTEHDEMVGINYEPNMTHNANGSWYCNDCQHIVILFDDDTHECDRDPDGDHADCVEIACVFSFDSWRGCTIPYAVIMEVVWMELPPPHYFRLDRLDMLMMAKEAEGDLDPIETQFGKQWPSDWVTDLYNTAIEVLELNGYYCDTFDGFSCWQEVKGKEQ